MTCVDFVTHVTTFHELRTTLMTKAENILTTLKTNGEDTLTTLVTSGEDTLTTLMTSGEDTLTTLVFTCDYLVTALHDIIDNPYDNIDNQEQLAGSNMYQGSSWGPYQVMTRTTR